MNFEYQNHVPTLVELFKLTAKDKQFLSISKLIGSIQTFLKSRFTEDELQRELIGELTYFSNKNTNNDDYWKERLPILLNRHSDKKERMDVLFDNTKNPLYFPAVEVKAIDEYAVEVVGIESYYTNKRDEVNQPFLAILNGYHVPVTGMCDDHSCPHEVKTFLVDNIEHLNNDITIKFSIPLIDILTKEIVDYINKKDFIYAPRVDISKYNINMSVSAFSVKLSNSETLSFEDAPQDYYYQLQSSKMKFDIVDVGDKILPQKQYVPFHTSLDDWDFLEHNSDFSDWENISHELLSCDMLENNYFEPDILCSVKEAACEKYQERMIDEERAERIAWANDY